MTMCGADLVGLGLGVVQAGPQQSFELQGVVAGQRSRRDVELDVVLPELGLVVRVGDRVQHCRR